MSQWASEHAAELDKLVGTAVMANRTSRIVKVTAGSSSGVKPKTLTVLLDGRPKPTEVGKAVGGAGKVRLYQLDKSMSANRLMDALAGSTYVTDIPTAKSVNVRV